MMGGPSVVDRQLRHVAARQIPTKGRNAKDCDEHPLCFYVGYYIRSEPAIKTGGFDANE